jgi:hypothetical protein
LTIDRTTGNVGVGTTTPTYKLDVNGNIRQTGISCFTLNTTIDNTSYGVRDLFSVNSVQASWLITLTCATTVGRTMSKLYNFATWFGSSGALWRTCLPTSGSVSGNDWEVDLQINVTTTTSTFRIINVRPLTGSVTWTISVMCQHPTNAVPTFTNNTGNAIYTDSNTYPYFASTQVYQKTNVGIDTQYPIEKLHVNGKIYGSNQILSSASNDTSNVPSFSWREDSNTGMYHPATSTIGFSTAGAPRMVINSSGNVGIGTTSPSTTLDVNGTINATTYQGTTITNISNMALFGSNTANWSSNNLLKKTGDTMSGALLITASLPFITLNTGSADATLAVASSGGQFSTSANGGDAVLRAGTAGSRLHLQTGTGASAICINSTNNVGIGTTTPSEKLHVIGKILASDDITAFSDRRLKSNITPITNGLSKVLQLTGYTFNKHDEDPINVKRHTGLIAQEVLEVLPEAVHKHNDGMYSVAYGNMAGLFVEAIKQQNEKIKELETQLATVQGQLNNILKSYLHV